MAEKTCGFTGHRDIPDSEIESVKHGLRKEFNKAIADGYTSYYNKLGQESWAASPAFFPSHA